MGYIWNNKSTTMKYLFLLTLATLFLTACSDAVKPRQLSSIDELTQKLDSLSTLIEANKLDSAEHYAQMAQGVELRIKNNYFSDTVDLALGKKMDAYKIMRRKFGPLAADYLNILNGSKEINESLRQLRHDIDNGDGERDKYDEYIVFEKSKVEQIEAMAKDYMDTREATMSTFTALHNEMDAFSRDLVKKAEAKKK